MNILVLQETDYLNRGPHTQHHIFERISKNSNVNVIILDYDIDKVMKDNSLFIKEKRFKNVNKAIKDSKVQVIRTAHIQIRYLRRISSIITNFFKILKILKKFKPDIIVGFSMTNGIIGLFFAKLLRIPYLFFYIDILHELVPIESIKRFARVISRLSFKLSDKVLVHTNYQKAYIINEGTNPEKIEISPDGISTNNLEINRKKLVQLENKYSLENDDFVIFFMGYLYEFAGLREIINYYNPKIKKGDLKLKFLILGDGGIYNSLKKYIDQNNIDWVILAGRVPFFEITEYIELADLCLLSFEINNITKEITPIKIIEYMAMKKPVLSTALPGVVHELGNNSGVIFANSQKDLIKRIEDLYHERDNLENLGRKGYDLVMEKFTWQKIINDFKNIMINSIKNKKE